MYNTTPHPAALCGVEHPVPRRIVPSAMVAMYTLMWMSFKMPPTHRPVPHDLPEDPLHNCYRGSLASRQHGAILVYFVCTSRVLRKVVIYHLCYCF